MRYDKERKIMLKNKDLSRKRVAFIYIAVTLLLTWAVQFIPIILHMNVEDTSISSFDPSSAFFVIGGMLPSLIGVVFAMTLYTKEARRDFITRCFVPNRHCVLPILISLALICLESFVAQMIAKQFGAADFGFEGLKLIASNPLMLFYFLFWGLISGPLSEEFGWRGFLTDCLFDKDKATRVALLIGAVWGIWHLPLYFYPAQIQYQWFQISPLLGIGFIVNCMSNALVYSAIYVVSGRRVFPIFFLHMFENIILTGAMIYPFSDIYSIIVVPVSIVIDIVFYVVFTRTGYYKRAADKLVLFSAKGGSGTILS